MIMCILSLFAWATSRCPLLLCLRVHLFDYLGIFLVLIVVVFIILIFLIILLLIFILIIIFSASQLAFPDDHALADGLLGATDQGVVLCGGNLPVDLFRGLLVLVVVGIQVGEVAFEAELVQGKQQVVPVDRLSVPRLAPLASPNGRC